MKNGKLRSKDFFDADQNPVIVFKSTRFVQIAPHTFEVDGDFTIRGVSNPEKLLLSVSGKGTDRGEIKGSMVFNRKDYGMSKGIPFITIADHVDVNFHLKGTRVAGPPLAKCKECGVGDGFSGYEAGQVRQPHRPGSSYSWLGSFFF